ncbi:uncharacterized protein CBL_08267 [Carabus blaptoides fortunei]
MQITFLPAVLALVVQHTFAQKFPEFIKKCKLSDPKFDDCVLASAKDSVDTIIRGNAKYGIPPMPLFSNETLTYNVSENFNFKLINETSNYLQNLEISYIHFDFEKKLLHFETKSPQTVYSGRYEADGEILGKPVHESGTITLSSMQKVTLDFKMKNDKKYLQFNPYDQVTAEEKKVYQSYIDKLPKMFKKTGEKFDVGIVKTLNSLTAV